MEQGSEDWELGANVGELVDANIEHSEGEAEHKEEHSAEEGQPEEGNTMTTTEEHPRVVYRPAEAPQPRVTDLRLVGIDMVPIGRKDLISLDALAPQKGTIFLGPPVAWAGLLQGKGAFMKDLRIGTLKLHKFIAHKDGRIDPGRLIHAIPFHYRCPICGAVNRLTHAQARRLKDINGQRRLTCSKPDCNNVELIRVTEELPHPPLDDPRVEVLWNHYERFARQAQDKGTSDTHIVPRVWALYKPDRAPAADWVPEEHDHKARKLEERALARGFTIRPFKEAVKAQSPHLKGLLLETTLDFELNPGMAVGFLSHWGMRWQEAPGYTVSLLDDRRPRARSALV